MPRALRCTCAFGWSLIGLSRAVASVPQFSSARLFTALSTTACSLGCGVDRSTVRVQVRLLATKPMQLASYFCTGTVPEEAWAHYALGFDRYSHGPLTSLRLRLGHAPYHAPCKLACNTPCAQHATFRVAHHDTWRATHGCNRYSRATNSLKPLYCARLSCAASLGHRRLRSTHG